MEFDGTEYNSEQFELEPHYDVEDIGCACTNGGIESEWVWNKGQNCYVCNGCGSVQ